MRAHVAGQLEPSRPHAAGRLERQPAQPRERAARGHELVGERREGPLAQAARTRESRVRAQRAGDGEHEAQGGAGLPAVERGAGERAKQSVLEALGPVNVTSAPSAQATGSMKRRVEPDSPQSSVAPASARSNPCSRLLGAGWISSPPSMRVMRAPSAARQRMVAFMSSQLESHETRVTPLASAGVHVLAAGIARDARDAVGERRGDDDAVRHRVGRDGGTGA